MTDDIETLQARFSYLVPLNKLPSDRQSRLLAQSEILELRKKDTIFKQGERDDYTFYVLEGDIEMYADDSLIKRVSGGEGASFQPLAQLQPRQMTAVAKTKARVLRIRRSLLEQLLSMDTAPRGPDIPSGVEVEEMETEATGDWLMTLLQSELFTRIPPSNIQALLDTLETIEVKAGDEVIKQGETGDYYYAIQTGACEVVRKGSNKREIRLAELSSGDTFGEEALISGAKRNATVRMTRDGQLARLTKDDFSRLIKTPLLSTVTRAEAERAVQQGAHWLDVRFEDEHAHNGLPASINIPLGTLRTRMDELSTEQRYVAYCDTGGRSSAAAFLLAEKGFDVCYVEGGAVEDKAVPPRKAAPAPVPAPTPAPATAAAKPKVASKPATPDPVLEAATRASTLDAEVARANLAIEQAQKLMAEAEAMKAEAERFVAAKLERERERLASEFAELEQRKAEAERLKQALAEREQGARFESERMQAEAARRAAELEQAASQRAQERETRIAREAEALNQRMAEAERLRETLDSAERMQQERLREEQRRIEREAAELDQRLAEVEQLKIKLARQQRSAEEEQAAARRLQEQQQKIEHDGALLTQKLADAEKLRATLLKQQEAAEREVARQHEGVDRRLAQLEQDASARLVVEQQRLEDLYRQQAEQLESLQAGREAELRDQLRKELAAERGKFELAVARTTAELEQARAERAAALAAKEAAAAEARAIIAEFKTQQQTLVAEQQAIFNKERERLKAEAARIDQLQADATRARKEAEAIKEAAERELAAARERKATIVNTADDLAIDTTIVEIERRALAANRDLKQAIEAESAIRTAVEEHEDELERTYNTANEINELLKKELDDWVTDQDKMLETTLQREVLSRQKEMVERIRMRAKAAKQQSEQQTQNLLTEIQSQLRK